MPKNNRMNRSWTFTAEVVSPGSQRTKPEFVSIKENGAGYFSTFKIAGNELNKNTTVAPEPEKQYTEWIDQTKSVTQVKPKNEFDLTTSIRYEPPGIQKPNKTKKAQVRTRVLTIAELLN